MHISGNSSQLPKFRLLRRFAWAIGALAVGVALIVGAYKFNNRYGEIVIPTHAVPNPNGYDDFVQAGRLAQAMPHQSPNNMPGPPAQVNTYANFQAAAQDSGPVMQAIRQGLSRPIVCPADRAGQSDHFKEYALMRTAARVVCSLALYEQAAGHPATAADTLLDGLEMSVQIPNGGDILPGLVSIACQSICTRPLESILPQLSAKELDHVARRMDTIAAKRASYPDMLEEEGYSSTSRLREAFKNPKFARDWTMTMQDATASPTWQNRVKMARLLFANKEAALAHHLAYHKKIAQEARGPYTSAFRASTEGDPFLESAADVLANSRQRFLALETAHLLLRVEVALYHYHQARGQYPAQLSELAPTYLKQVPVDPFTGNANALLHYAVVKKGQDFSLYSVGPDRRDDNGKAAKYLGDGGPGDITANHMWPAMTFTLMPPGKSPQN